MSENQEMDLLVFTDEDGNDVTMQVLDYFYYNGEEYAVLTEAAEHDHEACGCCHDECCECEEAEVFFMKVVPVDGEQVEFEPVSEELADTLFEVISSDFDEDEEEGEE